jgi:hypothetical protein
MSSDDSARRDGSSDESPDAIVVFHPSDPSKLEPFLDLDDENEESEGLYAEKLEDGTYLVHTFQPFEVFANSPLEVFEWLSQFEEVTAEAGFEPLHDDPRGLLFFPDSIEPSATTYDGLIAELADQGIFVPLSLPKINVGESSYEIGKMFENVQGALAEALGIPDLRKK